MDFTQVYRIPYYYYNQILYYHSLIIMDLDTLDFIGHFVVSLSEKSNLPSSLRNCFFQVSGFLFIKKSFELSYLQGPIHLYFFYAKN